MAPDGGCGLCQPLLRLMKFAALVERRQQPKQHRGTARGGDKKGLGTLTGSTGPLIGHVNLLPVGVGEVGRAGERWWWEAQSCPPGCRMETWWHRG